MGKRRTNQLTEELEMATVNAKKIAPVLIKEMLNWRRPFLPTQLTKIKKIYTQVFAEVWENENYSDWFIKV